MWYSTYRRSQSKKSIKFRLIRLPPEENTKMNNSILFRNNHIGESKIKGLENGDLKTGIYRNFYKS